MYRIQMEMLHLMLDSIAPVHEYQWQLGRSHQELSMFDDDDRDSDEMNELYTNDIEQTAKYHHKLDVMAAPYINSGDDDIDAMWFDKSESELSSDLEYVSQDEQVNIDPSNSNPNEDEDELSDGSSFHMSIMSDSNESSLEYQSQDNLSVSSHGSDSHSHSPLSSDSFGSSSSDSSDSDESDSGVSTFN